MKRNEGDEVEDEKVKKEEKKEELKFDKIGKKKKKKGRLSAANVCRLSRRGTHRKGKSICFVCTATTRTSSH